MSKIYSVQFSLNAKLIALIYICYKHKFPLQFMLSFYEMYGDTSLFALKALTCSRKTRLTDNEFIKIMEESRRLYSQIQRGISINLKRKQIKLGIIKDEEMPAAPKLDYLGFSESFNLFIDEYLLKNIDDIYAPTISLKMSTEDIYSEIS